MTPSASYNKSAIHNHQNMNTINKQTTSQPEAAPSVTDVASAKLVLERMYERFVEKFPPADAKIVEVQKWILRWFALDDTYMNDIAVPKYVSHLNISGSRLRALSDLAILQYLAIQNIRLCAGSGDQLYPKEVIEKLAADIAEARRQAIQRGDSLHETSEKVTDEQVRNETKAIGGLTEDELTTNLSNALQAHLTISQLANLSTLLGSNPIAPVFRPSTTEMQNRKDNSTEEAEILEFSAAEDSELLMQDTDGFMQSDVDTSALDNFTGADDDAYNGGEELEDESMDSEENDLEDKVMNNGDNGEE